MSRKKRPTIINGPFVALPVAIKKAPAWHAMSHGARLLWLELRGWLRNDGSNNGDPTFRRYAIEVEQNKPILYVENDLDQTAADRRVLDQKR
jgi:hypothetical protein